MLHIPQGTATAHVRNFICTWTGSHSGPCNSLLLFLGGTIGAQWTVYSAIGTGFYKLLLVSPIYTHLTWRNFICQHTVITETTVKQRPLVFIWFNIPRGNMDLRRPRVCRCSNVGLVYKMFTRCTLHRHGHMLINCNSQHLGLDSFTASLHSICQPAIRDIQETVSGLWKIEEIPTGHMSSQCITTYIEFTADEASLIYLTHSSLWDLNDFLFFKQNSVIDGWGILCDIGINWLSLNFTDDKSTLVQVMDWCRQVVSHYLSQCWPRSMLPYGVTGPISKGWCWPCHLIPDRQPLGWNYVTVYPRGDTVMVCNQVLVKCMSHTQLTATILGLCNSLLWPYSYGMQCLIPQWQPPGWDCVAVYSGHIVIVCNQVKLLVKCQHWLLGAQHLESHMEHNVESLWIIRLNLVILKTWNYM